MGVTFEEIARLAGVSKATVSRVINNNPEGVGAETRERVQQIIDELNYDVESLLASRRGMRTKSIGLIVPDIANPFFAELAKEVGNRASEQGYSVLLGNTDFSLDTECKFVNEFTAKQVAGIILVSAGSTARKEHAVMKKYGVPCLLLDRFVDGLDDAVAVLSDNAFATFSCCELLIRKGSRNIAFISGSTDVSTSRERLEGYKDVLERHQIPFDKDMVKYGDYTSEGGYNAIIELERSAIQYDAILAANDMMALGAIKALKELSYRIPEDIQVIGFDNIVFAQYVDPPLTTVQQPTIEMGRKAVELILEEIENGALGGSIVRLQPKLLRRKTTR